MADEFCLKMPDFHVTFMDILHAVNLRNGTDGFTSPPKEGVLRIFSPWKIQRLRAGLNPRTWVPKAGTLPLDHRSRIWLISMFNSKVFWRWCTKHRIVLVRFWAYTRGQHVRDLRWNTCFISGCSRVQISVHRPVNLIASVIFFNPFSKMSEKHLLLVRDLFLPQPFEFIIRSPSCLWTLNNPFRRRVTSAIIWEQTNA